jgi:hypothetical protein
VWIPTGSKISKVEAFVKQGPNGVPEPWHWTSQSFPIADLTVGAWNTFAVTVPPNAAVPLDSIGVEFSVSSSWTGAVYVDNVTW